MKKHSYISPKVKVYQSGINKKGVFAEQKIKKDEILAIWGGSIVSTQEMRKIARKKFPDIEHYATPIADGFYLVSSRKNELEDDDFFNHSCQPNAGLKGHIVLVAMRDIKKGEEITYDYAMSDANFPYRFTCGCQSEKCRRIVTGHDWKLPALQKKYRGYISSYVQENINSLKKKRK